MLIIEQQMLAAISRRQTWRRSNTSVVYVSTANISAVYLHNNLIALYLHNTGQVLCSSAGWRTRTTKSRLNALLVSYGRHIYQRHGVWYCDDGERFIDEPLGTILREMIDAALEDRRRTNDKNLFCA